MIVKRRKDDRIGVKFIQVFVAGAIHEITYFG